MCFDHSNVSTNVASRYRRPSPSRRMPLPTGEEECTFSPAVNRTPRALSHAVSEYLDDPAHLRLSRQPPSASVSVASAQGPGNGTTCNGRSMMRSISTPRERFGALSADVPPLASPSSASAPGDELFAGFLERQAAHLHKKRVAEQKRAEAVAAEREAMLSVGVGNRSARDAVGTVLRTHDCADGDGTKDDVGGTKPFLERVAEATERKRQQSSTADARLPTDQIEVRTTSHPHGQSSSEALSRRAAMLTA